MLAFNRLQEIAKHEPIAQIDDLGTFTEGGLLALKVAVEAVGKYDLVVIDSDYYAVEERYNVYCLTCDGRDLAQVRDIVEIIDLYTAN